MQRNKKVPCHNHESDTRTYIKTRRNYDGSRISSASHTVPNVGRRKAHQLKSNTRGKSSLDHQKNAKKAGVDQMAFSDSVRRRLFWRCGRCPCADLQRSAATRSLFTFSSPSPVQFTICRWKNVDVELPNVNACSGARTRAKRVGYFLVWFRAVARWGCTSVRASLHIGGKGTASLTLLPQHISNAA